MFRALPRRFCSNASQPLVEEFDVVIVGGGPAGLSAAIQLKKLAAADGNKDAFRIALVEKGSSIGAHLLSGACFETRAIAELFGENWKSLPQPPPITQPVVGDDFYYLTKDNSIRIPYTPPMLQNHGNYIISLSDLGKWMATVAEEEGVEIYPGFAAVKPVIEDDAMVGVRLNELGIGKDGTRRETYDPGMIFRAKQTIVCEGCRGSLTKQLFHSFQLRKDCDIQTYALGVKEIWDVGKAGTGLHRPGYVMHTLGWPLVKSEGHNNTYGGSFVYHTRSGADDGIISLGFVVGLDYDNPYVRPYGELQKFKTHPMMRKMLENGKCISYGARTLSEGGLASLPQLAFPGGVLAGDCAGTLNLPKIKGNHCAMKSGMLAAEAVYNDILKQDAGEKKTAVSLKDRFRGSWLYQELHQVRNCRQVFERTFLGGLVYTGVTALLTKGIEPITLKHIHEDHNSLKPAKDCVKIEYPKADGVLTFDLLTNHSRSGTTHNADQPAHLKIIDPSVTKPINIDLYDKPESRYCPAGVYEYVEEKLVINAQNCLHCKACDIKDSNINWTPPEGSGGPNYQGM